MFNNVHGRRIEVNSIFFGEINTHTHHKMIIIYIYYREAKQKWKKRRKKKTTIRNNIKGENTSHSLVIIIMLLSLAWTEFSFIFKSYTPVHQPQRHVFTRCPDLIITHDTQTDFHQKSVLLCNE